MTAVKPDDGRPIVLKSADGAFAGIEHFDRAELDRILTQDILLTRQRFRRRAWFYVGDALLMSRLKEFHAELSDDQPPQNSHAFVSEVLRLITLIPAGVIDRAASIADAVAGELAYHRPLIATCTPTPLEHFDRGVVLNLFAGGQDVLDRLSVSVSELIGNVSSMMGLGVNRYPTINLQLRDDLPVEARSGLWRYKFTIRDERWFHQLRWLSEFLPGYVPEDDPHRLTAYILVRLDSLSHKSSRREELLHRVREHLTYHLPRIRLRAKNPIADFGAGVLLDYFDESALPAIETSVSELLTHLLAAFECPIENTGPSQLEGRIESRGVRALAARGLLLPAGNVSVHATARFEPTCGAIAGIVGFAGTMGAFSFSNSALTFGILSIGRYCSIAHNVTFAAAEHPLDRISTSPFTYDSEFIFGHHLAITGCLYGSTRTLNTESRQDRIKIGHDVWIGEGVYIRGGVVIGDGAVIGARSVVTRDVPPFSVVAGSPARVIRARFDADLVAVVRESEWWNYQFPDFEGLQTDKPEQFIADLVERVRSGRLSRYAPEQIDGAEIASCFQ